MGVKSNITRTVTIGGVSLSEQVNLSGVTALVKQVNVPAALNGTLTTRTNNSDGSITVTGTNTITNGARVDMYWTVSGVTYVRRAATVGTVAGQVVPFTGSVGTTNLPATSTAMVICVATQYSFGFVGNNLISIAAYPGSVMGTFDFTDNASSELVTKFVSPNGLWEWHTNDAVVAGVPYAGDANPFAGVTNTYVYLSHMQVGSALTMTVEALLSN